MICSRPLWPWIVATVIAVPALYVASFGPACWLNERAWIGMDAVSIVYRPLIRIANKSPRARAGILWYARLGALSGREPSIVNEKVRWFDVFRVRLEMIVGPGQSVVDDSDSIAEDETK